MKHLTLTCPVAELTDIVRDYLEQRFRLRAGHQTTGEFLGDLERGKYCFSAVALLFFFIWKKRKRKGGEEQKRQYQP